MVKWNRNDKTIEQIDWHTYKYFAFYFPHGLIFLSETGLQKTKNILEDSNTKNYHTKYHHATHFFQTF